MLKTKTEKKKMLIYENHFWTKQYTTKNTSGNDKRCILYADTTLGVSDPILHGLFDQRISHGWRTF